MAAALQRAWLRRGPIAWLLLPVSLLYAAVTALHRTLYAWGMRRTERLPVPVLVVGNVVAGGAGKTPVVIALVRHLRQRGIPVGVVSRGHGRASTGCRQVRAGDDARETGDEPLLIARETGAPVFVAERRVEAARALLDRFPATELIVSDDGLQHHAMARDMEICVFDERGAGNGWLLPAGPLRERWPRKADFVLAAPGSRIEGYGIRRALAASAARADGETVPLAELGRRRVAAVAGIARPQAFFAMLEAAGVRPARTIALADHHDFATPPDTGGMEIVCTAKDAVKLWRTRPGAWAAGLEIHIDESFWRAFDRTVDAKLSSRHGPETA